MPENEDRAKIKAAILEHGLEEVKKHFFYPWIHKMVGGHKLSVEYRGITTIAVGYEDLDVEALEMYTECIIECTTDPTEKSKTQEVYDYWKANREEILRLHRVEVVD